MIIWSKLQFQAELCLLDLYQIRNVERDDEYCHWDVFEYIFWLNDGSDYCRQSKKVEDRAKNRKHYANDFA